MRQHLVVAIVCAASVASAKPKQEVVRATDKPKPIEMKDMVGKLDVYKDELDNYYVVPRADAATTVADVGEWLFYGDGKNFYQQRVIGQSSDGKNFEWSVWAPRARGINFGVIGARDGTATVSCRPEAKDQRELKQLQPDEAKTLIERAKFYPPLWRRQAQFLARDDEGVYYYVDMWREEFGGNGFRVFVGMKGAMKELAMTNVVSDSMGEIYATKSGQLKIIAGKNGTAHWIKGGKKIELTVVPPAENRYLIYHDLGIYGQLGAICDDL